MPGGKVVVHSGLLDIMRTDDELAAVLAHEIAHVIARHVVRPHYTYFQPRSDGGVCICAALQSRELAYIRKSLLFAIAS